MFKDNFSKSESACFNIVCMIIGYLTKNIFFYNLMNNLKYFDYLQRSNILLRFTLTAGFNLAAFTPLPSPQPECTAHRPQPE